MLNSNYHISNTIRDLCVKINFFKKLILFMNSFDYSKNKGIQQVLKNFSGEGIPSSSIVCSNVDDETRKFSKFLAQYIQCDCKNDFIPCFECINCKKIESCSHPDVVFPERSGNNKVYSVSTIRKIRIDSFVLPNEAKYKVYIFLDAQSLSLAAQNALLKILEDPPAKSIFLFFCNSIGKILPTVRSRSQIFNISFGGLVQGSEDDYSIELFGRLKDALVHKNEYEFMTLISKIDGDRGLFRKIISEFSIVIKETLKLKFGPLDGRAGLAPSLGDVAMFSTVFEVVKFVETLNEVSYMIEKNANFNLLMTYFVSNLF